MGCKLLIEAPVNGGRNYNGPKVDRCLSKIWPYAGIAEYPVVPTFERTKVTIHPVQPISRKGRSRDRNPQRLDARRLREQVKIESDLHGDMQGQLRAGRFTRVE